MVENLSLGPQGTCPLAPVTRFAVRLTLINKERLVFGVTDGVTTLEEVTPWEGGAHVSGDKFFSFNQF